MKIEMRLKVVGLLAGLMLLSFGLCWADEFSSDLFIASLGLVNADGNITSYDLTNDPNNYGEANPLLAPVAKGYSRYLYFVPVGAALVVAHDQLKTLNIGAEDVLSCGVIVAEIISIRSWAYSKDDIGFEIALSEAEVFATSRLLNIKF